MTIRISANVICFALEKAGMTTEAAVNGVDAIDRFAIIEPSLVVLDIGMPEMDELEVCRRLRKSSEVPILFLSARDEEIDRILGLEIGGDDYVTKPFSPREVVARVNVILRQSKMRPADRRKSRRPMPMVASRSTRTGMSPPSAARTSPSRPANSRSWEYWRPAPASSSPATV